MSRRSLPLLLLAAAAQAAPVVFSASDPVAPGEAVLAIGHGFGQQPKVELTRLPDAAPGAPSAEPVAWPAVVARPEALQPCDTSVKFAIPATSKPGVFAYRLTGVDGAAVGLLNRPVLWWAQGQDGASAAPGGWLRLFGRNLAWPAGVKGFETAVRLTGPKNVVLSAEADVWSARVTLPADLPAGTYQIQLHNGAGGPRAWSQPLPVTVAALETWPQRVYNVKDFGADGSGRRDDTAAIQAALDKAGAEGGGIVRLPRGRYECTAQLKIPRFTVLRGEREDLTCLFWPPLAKPPESLVRGGNHFVIEELTLFTSSHRHVIVGDTGDKADSGHVRLWRVRVRADNYWGHLKEEEVDARLVESMKLSTGGGDTVQVGGPAVEIGECDLYGTGRSLYLMRAKGGWVHDNQLYNGRWGWYCLSGSDGLIFEHNHFAGADLMSTGGGLNCLDGSNYSQNVYYAGNDLRHTNGWDREVMTSDAGGGPYLGGVTAANGVHLTLASEPKWGHDWSGAGVFVLDGAGAGQIRRLAGHDGAKITLDRPLDLPPDATTILAITQYQGHYMLIGNHFADCGPVQFFGTGIENIVAGNTGERMQAFQAWALWYYGFQPCIGCQFLDNHLSESYYHWSSADDSFIGLSGAGHEGYKGPMNLGGVLRRNVLHANASVRVRGSVRDALIENTAISDGETGVFVSQECRNVLVRGTQCRDVTHELLDEPGLRAAGEARLKRFIGGKDPIASWDFEQLVGGKWPDGSGNRFFAAPEGGVKPTPEGHQGQGLVFDGSTGYVRVDEPAAFNVPDVTISLWLKPEVLSGRRGLVAKRFNGTGTAFVVAQNGPTVTFEACDEAGAWNFNFGTGPVLKAGAWTHLAVVAQTGVGVVIYVDGKEAARKSNPAPRYHNDEPLVIGREAWGGDPPKGETPGYFKGVLDEIRIWGRALSPAEVADAAR
jgi:hypothetical protein